ncbi:MAG: flagellar export protein FliJ [Nitratireductor sp.]|nr:flagellar export protein FliJ [Nitratireductor sp.]MCC0022371.1 flagellar export protein FliJ [Nitratireductor sp.]
MKSRDNLLRLKHFQVQEKTRQLAQIDMMIADFNRMGEELRLQIEHEEKKSGITDVNHFAYPTFAKAARTRRENIEASVADLKDKRSAAEQSLAEAEEELKKVEAKEARDSGTARELTETAVDAVIERRMMIG